MRFRYSVPESPPATASVRVPLKPAERVIPILSSDGKKTYPVRKMPDGRLICPCEGFGYRQACRHAREARELLESERASA